MRESRLRAEIRDGKRLFEVSRGGEDLAKNGVEGSGGEGPGVFPGQRGEDRLLPGRVVNVKAL